MKYILWLLSISFFCNGYCQSIDTAVISHVQQEVKLYPSWRSILSKESFPDYFRHDTTLRNSLYNTIKESIQQKFGVKLVISGQEQAIDFFINTGVPKNPSTSGGLQGGNIYVTVSNSIGLTTTATDNTGLSVKNFNYTSKVRAEDRNGNVIFEGNAVIPFRTAIDPNHMYGIAELGKEQVEQLFRKAFLAAIANKTKKLPVQKFYKPSFTHPTYETFIAGATSYFLEETIKDVPVLKGETKTSQFMFVDDKLKVEYELNLTQAYIGNPKAPEENYTCRATLTNALSQTEYQMWGELRWKNKKETENPVSEAFQEKPEVVIRCMAERLLMGDFTLNNQRFEGLAGYKVYTVRNILPKNTIEIRMNNQLKAIVQKGSIRKETGNTHQLYHIYMSKDAGNEEKGEWLTIFLLNKIAAEFGRDFL
jgi:hypothetical protein